MATAQLWASKDRVTIWSRKYQKQYPDGTTETYTVDKVRVRYPSRQQVHLKELSAMVIPSSRILVSRKTGMVERHTHYYCFGQSFWGGASAKGDSLGGFGTGQYVECYETRAKSNIRKLLKDGFTRKGK